jgi:cytochrome c
MKRIAITLIAAGVLSIPAMADDAQLAKESETVVVKVVKLLATNPQAVISDINTGDKKWFTGGGEVYPIINSIDGISLANAQNPKTAGKDVNGMTDMNGKEIVKERIALAKSKGKFWYEYAWTDPVSKKVLPKKTYCERAGNSGEYIVCAGYYKR